MDEQRQKAYFNLIQQVLSCPNGQELAVLRSHEDLVDADFVRVMEEIATQMAINGQQGAADFLLELADKLCRAFSISEEYVNFLLMVLKVTYENDNNPQAVYLLLQTRLNRLNETFAQVLQNWANSTFQTEQSIEKKYELASIIVNFSNLIQNLPLGNRANNLEIAIKGFEVVFQVFKFDVFPKEWAIAQTNLGNAYRDRLRGDRSKNLEQSIGCHMQAFHVFKREIFPEEWAATQNNLAATYGKRIVGDREQNLEDAIAAIESALQIYKREVFPKDWAMAQNNLGLAYSDRIKGDRAKNLKKAITVFQDALQVRTLETCPQDWAMTQNNLGVSYYNLVDDYRSENLERAIESYLNALQVRTYEAFPEDWAETHINLGNAYMDRIIGEREQNLEWAIISFEKALQVYNRDIFPERWALVHNNLGNVYRYQGQIDKAVKYFRSALEIRTPTAFPLECLMSGNNLGTTAFNAELWADAIEGYKLAQEAVETSRESVSTSWRASEILQDAMIVYVNLVQAYINVEQLEKALETVERSKARNLVDLIATRNLCPKGDIPETILNQLKYLYREIDIEQRRLEIKQSNSLDNVSERLVKYNLETTSLESTISDRAKLNQLRQQLDELISIYITPVDPTFSITQKVNPISYSEIQDLMNENTAIIEWYFIGDIFLTFIIASQCSRPIIWQSSKEDLKDLMDLGKAYMRAYLENKDEWEQALSNSLKSLAQILHINDILKHIPPNIKQLVLIPHRYLHLFPLHALEGKRENAAGNEELYAATRCLLDLFSDGVKYAPSCQLLQQVQAKHRPNFNKLFALQNPTKDLAYADLEVLAIQPYFHSSHILVKATKLKADILPFV